MSYDLIILIIIVFWHNTYLIIMGFLMSLSIFQKIKDKNTAANGGDININDGWKLLLWGAFFGTVDYLAGIALEFSSKSIIQMVGFNGEEGTSSSSTKVFKYPTAGGETTQTTTTTN